MNSVEVSLLAALVLLVCSNLVDSHEHYNPARLSLGHFPRLPQGIGKDLYQKYFETYVEEEMAEKDREKKLKLDNDDWRKYSPTYDYCAIFLKKFISRNYKLEYMLDIIQLDSCLGYLYDDHEYKWTDPTSHDDKKILETLINDENLKKIYSGTKFETLDSKGVQFLKKFFDFAFEQAYFGKTSSCERTTWIRVTNLYAHGYDLLGNPDEDTYVDLLSDVVRRFGQKCFKELAEFYSVGLNFIKYDTGVLPNLKNLIATPARQQLVEHNWPKKLLKVFQTSMGISSSTAINFDQLQILAYRLKQNEPNAQKSLTFTLGHLANKKIKRPYSISQEETDVAYDKLKGDLCNDYINQPMVAWIRLLSYPKFFGNMEWVIFNNEDPFFGDKIRTMYLATFMCRYIDQTFVTLYDRYVVKFRDDTTKSMQIWPMQPPK